MKVNYTIIPLRPYPGNIYLFRDLEQMKVYYINKTGNKYEYQDENTGGRFVRLEFNNKEQDTIWLIYAKKPHVLAHEIAHVLLILFKQIGSDPAEGSGEPFCYMLSQIMIEAGWK